MFKRRRATVDALPWTRYARRNIHTGASNYQASKGNRTTPSMGDIPRTTPELAHKVQDRSTWILRVTLLLRDADCVDVWA